MKELRRLAEVAGFDLKKTLDGNSKQNHFKDVLRETKLRNSTVGKYQAKNIKFNFFSSTILLLIFDEISMIKYQLIFFI